MRHFIKIIIAFLVTSCLSTVDKKDALAVPKDSKTVITTLRDSLGTVIFSLPVRFDTAFNWTNHSDCGKPCDQEQYRFQQKSYPVFKESGFYHSIPDIPIDQFTIIHSGYIFFPSRPDTSKRSIEHEFFKDRLSSDLINEHVKFDTLEKINDRYFSIIYMTGFDSARLKHFAKVAALTTIKGNEIEFHYDIKSKDPINERAFFDNSTEFIRTIRISNGI